MPGRCRDVQGRRKGGNIHQHHNGLDLFLSMCDSPWALPEVLTGSKLCRSIEFYSKQWMRVWRALLFWAPQQVHPETRIQGQVVHLGDDPRKQQHGKRERETHKGRGLAKGVCQASYCYGQWELSILVDCGEHAPMMGTQSLWDVRAILLAGQVCFHSQNKAFIQRVTGAA